MIGNQGDSYNVQPNACSKHHHRLLRVDIRDKVLFVRMVHLILPSVDRVIVTLLHQG